MAVAGNIMTTKRKQAKSDYLIFLGMALSWWILAMLILVYTLFQWFGVVPALIGIVISMISVNTFITYTFNRDSI